MVYPITQTDEIGHAMQTIWSWGYPRAATQGDWNGVFLNVGDWDCIVWFEDFSGIHPGYVAIHMAKNPETRGQTMGLETWPGVVEFAASQGWLRMYALDPDESMIKYIKTLGFQEDERVAEWWYYEV